MTQFGFRPLALEDLQDLLTYIATENPQAALRMHDCILETCATLGENPEIAVELGELSVSAVRRFPVAHYSRYIHDIMRLRKQHGIGRWRKLKGIATVKLDNGNTSIAEVHWYEAHGIGKRKMKIKRLLDG